jgi:hypothetical protein
MVSSSPTTPEPATPPTPRHERLDTIAAQIAALDELVHLALRSIRVFDVDLSDMGWNSIARADALGTFLRRSKHVRLDIVVHDTRYLEGQCARLQLLHHRYGHAITFSKTGPEAKAARDPLTIVDSRHYLHRFDIEQPRAALGIEQPHAVIPLLNRFDEIWATRESTLPGTLLGF